MIKAVMLEIDGEEIVVPYKDAVKFSRQIEKLKNPVVATPPKKLDVEAAGKLCGKLWELSPQSSRSRTSKLKVWSAWKAVTNAPPDATVLAAYRAWLKCDDWTKDDGQYIFGLHRWIKDRQWENVPAEAKKCLDSSCEMRE